jgi:hypothetical protein
MIFRLIKHYPGTIRQYTFTTPLLAIPLAVDLLTSTIGKEIDSGGGRTRKGLGALIGAHGRTLSTDHDQSLQLDAAIRRTTGLTHGRGPPRQCLHNRREQRSGEGNRILVSVVKSGGELRS